MMFMKMIAGFSMLLLLNGCLWFGSSPAPRLDRVSATNMVSLEVLDTDRWNAGGSLIFIPFTPGAGAEAGPRVDRIALMIVKGFSDYTAGHRGVFQLLTGENALQAQFILDGRIDEFEPAGSLRVIGIGRKKVALRVSGEVLDRETGEVIARFKGTRLYTDIRDTDLAAGDIGQELGEKVQH
jgi:hypothetical protein